jgi:hypothetical protein
MGLLGFDEWGTMLGVHFINGRGQPMYLHCHLAKFRGLMYEEKYGAVIGGRTKHFLGICLEV